jgi:signal-transduction protein with cAMP-binding, CBS, and nucleotidyltransferase domain/PAS domain-containing protein
MHLTSKDISRFLAGIVFPSILTVLLFIVSMYVFIIPTFEKNIMDKKREMLSELVNATWSLIEEYNQDYADSLISLQEAKDLSIKRIEKIRYGKESKDYFWIIDMQPKMIMHPYRKELNGTELTDYKDQAGKLLFVEAVNIVDSLSEGFVDYMWQWKDDSSRIVPKLSFVKKYENWNWIIGTGIYIEDVKEEISILKKRLNKIAFIIFGIIGIIIIIIVKQSLDIERRRKSLEDKLKASRRKYQSLVEASVDGTILIIDNEIRFSNMKFNSMLGSSASYVLSLKFDDIFDISWNKLKSKINISGKSESFDAKLKSLKKPYKEIVLTISKVFFGKQEGYIIIVKDITQINLVEKETEQLSNEVQTSLLLMNQSIKHFIKDLVTCDINTPINEVARIMTRKNCDVIFTTQNQQIIGLITDSDIRSRIIAENFNISNSIAQFISAPVISVKDNILLYEAILMFKDKQLSHLAVKNNQSDIVGVISNLDIHEMNRNSISFLVREVEASENIYEIEKTTKKLPILIKALINSGARTQNITRIITSLTDAITQRVIHLTIETIGNPPCKFEFIAVGSEGRMEQTLATDQDNAIIFENVNADNYKVFKQYFLELGKVVAKSLDYLGFKYCNGEVMANNPKWVLSIDEWKNQFKDWINNSDPKSILEAGIFFDLRCVYGDQKLTNDLTQFIFTTLNNKAVFFQHMANPILKYKSVVNLFGNIVSNSKDKDSSNIDVKKIILPIISFIRLYSLKYNITETNSILRLEKLRSLNHISKSLYNEIIISLNYLMLLRFKFQVNKLIKNKTPDNLIDINDLTDIEKTTIKKIISEISNLQTQLNFDFKGGL